MTIDYIRETFKNLDIPFVGIQKDIHDQPRLVLFNNKFGSTIAIRYNEFSKESILEKQELSERRFNG